MGFRSTTDFDAADREVARVDALGFRSTSVLDAAGQGTASIAADGAVSTSVFDRAGRVEASVDALAYRSTTVFDAASQPVASVDALGFRSTTVFDAAGQAVASVDPLGFRSTTVFDATGRRVATQDALGFRSTTVFDASGAQVASVDALNFRSTTVYDSFGRQEADVSPLGHRSTTVFDSFGRSAARVDARGFRWSTIYDEYGRAAASQDSLGYRTTTLFDLYGRSSGSLNALGHRTTTAFDPLNRPVTHLNELGLMSTTVFDALGREEATVDPLGRRQTRVFDKVGRLQASVNGLGYRTSMVYDLRGGEIERVNARGYRSSTVFDALARPHVEIDALNRRVTLVFDPAGNRTQTTDGRGWTITTQFDAVGRETVAEFRDGTRSTTTFDPVGRATAVSGPLGIWTRTFDGAGQLATEAAPSHSNFQPLTNLYDATGNRTELRSWFGILTSTFDARSLMTGLLDPNAGRSTWVFDELGRWIELRNSDGTASTLTYDGANQTTGVRHRDAGAGTLDLALMAYDPVGNPLNKSTQDGVHSMTYDPANQLLSENHPLSGVKTWVFDPVGNRLSQDHTQVGVRTVTNWVYDPADQLQTETTGTAVTTFSFDGAGERSPDRSPHGPHDEHVGQREPSLAYRAAGRSAEHDVLPPRRAAAPTRGQRGREGDGLGRHGLERLRGPPAGESAMSSALRTYYRGHSLVAMRDEAAAENRTFHFDHQGTTQLLTNQAGVVTDRFAADAWGVEVKRTGSSINRHWYVGGRGYLRQTGADVDYLRRRYYRASTGRLTARDPAHGTRLPTPLERYAADSHVVTAKSNSAYIYSDNRVALLIDPSGLLPAVLAPVQPRFCTEWSPTSIAIEDCCSQANRDRYFNEEIAAHCVINGNPGSWSPCPDSNAEARNCNPRREHCPVIEELIVELAQTCVLACRRRVIYRPDTQWGAATMCCYNAGETAPKFCEIRCCISPEAGHMPPQSTGVDACIRYCLLGHERTHQTRECASARRPRPAPSNDYDFPFDECCAYVAQVSCLFTRYKELCGLGRQHVKPCLDFNRTRCEGR